MAKLTRFEESAIKSLMKSKDPIQRQINTLEEKAQNLYAKRSELSERLVSIDNTIKGLTGGLTGEEYFGQEVEVDVASSEEGIIYEERPASAFEVEKLISTPRALQGETEPVEALQSEEEQVVYSFEEDVVEETSDLPFEL